MGVLRFPHHLHSAHHRGLCGSWQIQGELLHPHGLDFGQHHRPTSTRLRQQDGWQRCSSGGLLYGLPTHHVLACGHRPITCNDTSVKNTYSTHTVPKDVECLSERFFVKYTENNYICNPIAENKAPKQGNRWHQELKTN